MAQEKTSMTDFSFDDENTGWFDSPEEDKTDTSKVVAKAKVGTTIDEAEEDDDDDTPTNLEESPDEEEEEIEDIKPTKVKPVKKVEKIEGKEKKGPISEDSVPDAEEDNEEEFGEFSEESEEKEGVTSKKKDSEEGKDEVTDEDFYSSLAEELKEKGVLGNVEIPKDKKLTEEEFFELQDEEVEARAAETLEAFLENADEDGKAYVKHLRRGGKLKDFVEAYYGSGIDYDTIDLEDEIQRDSFLRSYLISKEGKEAEEAETYIQFLKDGGKADTTAAKYLAKSKKEDEAEKAAFEVKEAARITKIKEDNKKYHEGLIAAIDKADTIGAFTITKSDKAKLKPFMTKATVKVGKDKYIPEFQSKLVAVMNAKTAKDKENLIILGKLLANDFDISDLVPKAETKVVKRANSILQRAKASSVKGSSSNSYSKRVLADFFDEPDN
jgi:hypothetical protein